MADQPAVFLLGTECPPELEDKFNKWYNETHIPMLLKSKRLLGATRYKLSEKTPGGYPKYLTIYLFKDQAAYEAWTASPERKAAGEERKVTWAEKNFEVTWRAVYEPLKTWKR